MRARRRATKQEASGNSIDVSNYLNWPAVLLQEKLTEAKINPSTNFPNSVLRKLYVDNVLEKRQAQYIRAKGKSGPLMSTPLGLTFHMY